MAQKLPTIEHWLEETRRHQGTASHPATSVWVSANAGTGKTHVLTMRVLRLLLAGTAPQSILCLTYTKAAAAEMSKRVFEVLAKWVTLQDSALAATLTELTGERPAKEQIARARTLFAAAIETPGGLKIQTIHAFAEKLLQRFPLEAGVSPGFSILAEDEAFQIRRDSIDATLLDATQNANPALAEALANVIGYATSESFDNILSEAVGERAWLDTFAQLGAEEVDGMLRTRLGVRPGVTRSGIEQDMASVMTDAELRRAHDILASGSKNDQKAAAILDDALRAPSLAARAGAMEDLVLTDKGTPRQSLMTKPLAAEHPDVEARLKRAQERIVDLSTERIACETITATISLYQLASAVLQRYTAAKERRSALDFDDLIARTGSLLRMSDSAEWVLYKLDSALAHILVDESQDTSPEQWRIIEALAREFFSGSGAHEETRTLFAVGDEKQSIYSFQGAEADEFARRGIYFTKAATAAGVTWRTVPLSLSFRTVEPVLKAVDTVFADPQRTPGVKRQDTEIRHQARRIGQAGLVEIWPTEVYSPPADVDAWQPLEEEAQETPVARLAARIAGTIRTWLDEKEMLVSEDRRIRPGDILILVRKRNPFATPMTAALKARGIAVAGADRIDLIEQIAVQDLMALGDFLTLPEDDLSLAAVLKSPLFGFDDDDLLTIAAGRKRTLWRALIDHAGTSARFSEAANTLKLWRSRADFMPPYEFLATLLDKDKARMKLVARLGPDAAEAIDELTGLALTYDDQAAPSLSGFLNWLRTGSREIKRDMEHGRNEVRVMTVHGAKGLEAPIVFLPDTCTTASAGTRGGGLVALPDLAPPETADPFLWCLKGSSRLADIAAARDAAAVRETHERNRLLYVAMTRARDRLYIAGFEGKQGRARGCWYDSITEALAPVLKPVELGAGLSVQRLEATQTADCEDHRETDSTVLATAPLPDWSFTPAPREPQLAVPLAPSRLAPLETDEEGEALPRQKSKEQIVEPASEIGRAHV